MFEVALHKIVGALPKRCTFLTHLCLLRRDSRHVSLCRNSLRGWTPLGRRPLRPVSLFVVNGMHRHYLDVVAPDLIGGFNAHGPLEDRHVRQQIRFPDWLKHHRGQPVGAD